VTERKKERKKERERERVTIDAITHVDVRACVRKDYIHVLKKLKTTLIERTSLISQAAAALLCPSSHIGLCKPTSGKPCVMR